MESSKPKARRRFHYTMVVPRKQGLIRPNGEHIDGVIATALANCSRTANCAVRIINLVPLEFDGMQYITVICEEV